MKDCKYSYVILYTISDATKRTTLVDDIVNEFTKDRKGNVTTIIDQSTIGIKETPKTPRGMTTFLKREVEKYDIKGTIRYLYSAEYPVKNLCIKQCTIIDDDKKEGKKKD